jgi:hypothetical protein
VDVTALLVDADHFPLVRHARSHAKLRLRQVNLTEKEPVARDEDASICLGKLAAVRKILSVRIRVVVEKPARGIGVVVFYFDVIYRIASDNDNPLNRDSSGVC